MQKLAKKEKFAKCANCAKTQQNCAKMRKNVLNFWIFTIFFSTAGKNYYGGRPPRPLLFPSLLWTHQQDDRTETGPAQIRHNPRNQRVLGAGSHRCKVCGY